MNTKILPVTFQGKTKVSGKKAEAQNQNAIGAIKEEDIKNTIQKVTTPGFRKAVLGAASFLAVMFAARRLAVTPVRTIIFKAYPKSANAFNDFVNNAKPIISGFGNNLKNKTKDFLSGEKFLDFAKKITKNEETTSKLVSGAYKAAKYLGTKASEAAKWGLKNPNKVVDYAAASAIALLSSKGIIKIDNLSSKKKIENILGDNKEDGKE